MNYFKYISESLEKEDNGYIRIFLSTMKNVGEKEFNKSIEVALEISNDDISSFLEIFHKTFRQIDVFDYLSDMNFWHCINSNSTIRDILITIPHYKDMSTDDAVWEFICTI